MHAPHTPKTVEYLAIAYKAGRDPSVVHCCAVERERMRFGRTIGSAVAQLIYSGGCEEIRYGGMVQVVGRLCNYRKIDYTARDHHHWMQ